MGKRFEVHRFFCVKCGNEGIPITRSRGHRHERFHKKKLYCPNCKIEVNHVECQNEEDVYNFKLDFKEGVYANEAKESLSHMRTGWRR